MKYFISFALFLITFSNLCNAQMFKKGDVIIDSYYGFPNLYPLAVDEQYYVDVLTEKKGVYGFRFERLADKRLSHGVEFLYTSVSFRDREKYKNPNITDHYEDTIGYVNLYAQKFSLLYTMNFHYIRNIKKLDGYIMWGVGLKYRDVKINNDVPDYIYNKTSEKKIGGILKLGIGYRYFITKNIGVNLSVMIGGPIVTTGISFKF